MLLYRLISSFHPTKVIMFLERHKQNTKNQQLCRNVFLHGPISLYETDKVGSIFFC